MDEILKQLKEISLGAIKEKDSFTDALRERQQVIVTYQQSLDKLTDSILDKVKTLEAKVLALVQEENAAKQGLQSINAAQQKAEELHNRKTIAAEKHLAEVLKEIAAAEVKHSQMDKTVAGLTSEYHSLSERMEALRGNISATERHMVGLSSEEKALEVSVSEKRAVLGDLTEKITSAQQTYSRINGDVTILEARLKKLQ